MHVGLQKRDFGNRGTAPLLRTQDATKLTISSNASAHVQVKQDELEVSCLYKRRRDGQANDSLQR